jgi:hypothetical protein
VTSLGNPKIITLLWFGDRSKHLLRIFSCDISLQATAIDLRRQGSAADAYQAFGPAIEPIQKRITEARSRCSHRRLVATDRGTLVSRLGGRITLLLHDDGILLPCLEAGSKRC